MTPKPLIPRTFSDFESDDRGVIAIATALTLTVVILALGITNDFTPASKLRQELQAAADAATLAGAELNTDKLPDRQNAATRMFLGSRTPSSKTCLPGRTSSQREGAASESRFFVLVTDGVSGGRSRGDVWSEPMTKPCDPVKDRGPSSSSKSIMRN